MIEQIKIHGACLALEAELTKRIQQLNAAVKERKWTYAYSHAKMCSELAEELRKMGDKCDLTSREQSSKPSQTL